MEEQLARKTTTNPISLKNSLCSASVDRARPPGKVSPPLPPLQFPAHHQLQLEPPVPPARLDAPVEVLPALARPLAEVEVADPRPPPTGVGVEDAREAGGDQDAQEDAQLGVAGEQRTWQAGLR